MNDDYTYEAIEARYGDMDAGRLNGMSIEERCEYYHSMYQYFGRMLNTLHEPRPHGGDTDNYPAFSEQEYWMLSSASNSLASLLDNLAGLVSATETE